MSPAVVLALVQLPVAMSLLALGLAATRGWSGIAAPGPARGARGAPTAEWICQEERPARPDGPGSGAP
jgi:hypothetical protein